MIDVTHSSHRSASRADVPHIVLAGDDGPVSLGTPAWTLRARGADALRALPDRVEQALARDCRFACGLIPYDAGLALHGVAGANGEAVVHLFRDRPRPYQAAPERRFELTTPFQAEQSRERYRWALNGIFNYLAAGDVYQVNYAQRFQARWAGDALAGFDRLLAAHPAPHAGFFRDGKDAVFGVSPERFLSIDHGVVRTEPIKGSRPRGVNEEEDRALGEALRRHPKDRAENLMIVDLLRNDLGEFCQAGSIRVDPLFELRRFSNVQHLVSTITGTLRPGVAPLAALLSAFPGGSITGAPKKRAMEIIQELEPATRGAYCGSLFWQDHQGRFDSNILIRTLQTDGDALYCHGGGGIVYDSDPDEEYEESWFKVRKLMEALSVPSP
ncbi:anthranilate synthase component I family protein [Alloalcanivorax sp. C16-2]|uniref:anthranilate synthase component I family protein n=1 Tax=Alloalcanivorax TaxID=3020832 RepID=UPI001932BD02|nr:anthranilate synthase component I family protein [Alloalcanivorax marinus]MBL7249860.1 anthranilate synthase component I family protein [Alloalcanivorax marinus]